MEVGELELNDGFAVAFRASAVLLPQGNPWPLLQQSRASWPVLQHIDATPSKTQDDMMPEVSLLSA